MNFRDTYMILFSGPALVELLDSMPMVDRKTTGPLMMPVSEKYKDMGTVVVGKIESGRLRKNDTLLLMPNKVSKGLLPGKSVFDPDLLDHR